jgi:DNA repair protein RecN (Recombination protein N)
MTAEPSALPAVVAGDGLVELAVSNLGVVRELRLVVGRGMTAITGETGAGKTLLLTALELLTGGRAEAVLVGPYGSEAVVSGRFVLGGEELVLERVVPADGRSRAYVNGRPATVGTLAEFGEALVEIHGQHGSLSLTRVDTQRQAVDRFGAIDTSELVAVRRERKEVAAALEQLGGDRRERIRRAELFRHQLAEIEAGDLGDPAEDDALRHEAELLADAAALRHGAATAAELLGGDGGADAAVRAALHEVLGRAPLAELADQIAALAEQLADAARAARLLAETIEEDPERLAWVNERRRQLGELRRKYGDTLADVVAYGDQVSLELAELDADDDRRGELDATAAALAERERALAAAVGTARRGTAPALAAEVARHLQELALPGAELVVTVGAADPGDDIEMLLSTNRGTAPAPLAKVGSGGELSRAMLALRLVLSAGPPIMVFDEVDAGIGGEAALSVGRALASLASGRQVFVVTHLAQVAAFADHQIRVTKADLETSVQVDAELLMDDDARIVELSRMLSGSPDSERANAHAAELLAEGRARSASVGSRAG